MTPADQVWFSRVERLTAGPYERWVHPPGGTVRRVPFLAYARFVRCHRWLWFRGLKL